MAGHNSRLIRLRIRTAFGEPAVGPGKADLLEQIEKLGSIAAAAREMEMSYRRAWGLVKLMNAAFQNDVVIVETGGSGGGRAELTPTGKKVLRLYREAELAASKASARHVSGIRRLMRDAQ